MSSSSFSFLAEVFDLIVLASIEPTGNVECPSTKLKLGATSDLHRSGL